MNTTYNESNWYLKEYNKIRYSALEYTLEFLNKLLTESEDGKLDILAKYYEFDNKNNYQHYITAIFIVLDSLEYIFDSMQYWNKFNQNEESVNSILDILEKLYNLYICNNINIGNRYQCREYIEYIFSYVLGSIFHQDDCTKKYTGRIFDRQYWMMHRPIIIRVIKFTGQIMIDLASMGENPYVLYMDIHEYGDGKTLSSIPYINVIELHANEEKNKYLKSEVLGEIEIIVKQVKTVYEKYLKDVNLEIDYYLIPDLARIVSEYLPNEENSRYEMEEFNEEYDS